MRALSEIIQKATSGGVRGFARGLFYVSRHGKLPETAFLGRIALSVTVIIGSLSAMALSAYAYFQTSEVAMIGTLQSAEYSLEMTANGALLTDGKLQGTVGETYEVTLKKSGSAQTGFCVITVRQDGVQDVVYHTQQIGADQKVDGGWTEQITFAVTFNGAATLDLEPHWGTSSSYSYVGYEAFDQEPQENHYIIGGETLTVAANVLQSVGTTAPNTTQTVTTTTVTTSTTPTTITTTMASAESTSTTSASGESISTAVATETTSQTPETTSATAVTEETAMETTTTEVGEVNTTTNEEN